MKKQLLLAAVLATAALSVSAQSSQDKGPYLLGAVGLSNISSQLDVSPSSTSLGLAYGVHINRTWAVETSYTDFGNRQTNGLSNSQTKWEGISFSGVAKSPLGKKWDLLGKLGLAHTDVTQNVGSTRVSYSGNSYVLGVGVDYRLSRDMQLRLMYEAFPDFGGYKPDVLNSVTIGVKYRI